MNQVVQVLEGLVATPDESSEVEDIKVQMQDLKMMDKVYHMLNILIEYLG